MLCRLALRLMRRGGGDAWRMLDGDGAKKADEGEGVRVSLAGDGAIRPADAGLAHGDEGHFLSVRLLCRTPRKGTRALFMRALKLRLKVGRTFCPQACPVAWPMPGGCSS